MKKIWKKKLVVVVVIALMIISIIPGSVMEVNAASYSASRNKMKTTYKLTGNGANDIVGVAKAQLGRKYTAFSHFHGHAWCADFVSACAVVAGQSKAVPGNASVSGIRTAIKKAGGVEYSRNTILKGKYTPKKGDIIIFKSNGDSHVGIVDKTSGSKIYYIDGNWTGNGNGNKSRVHYSSKKKSYKGFTCVVKPKYKNSTTAKKTTSKPATKTTSTNSTKTKTTPVATYKINLVNYRTVHDGIYQIKLYGTGYGLSIEHNSKEKGGNVHLWTIKDSNEFEKFRVCYQGKGYYKIFNAASGLPLDVNGAASNAGTNVQQWTKNSSSAQLWQIISNSNGGYNLVPMCAKTSCLDVTSNKRENGTNIQIYPANNGSNQRFEMKRLNYLYRYGDVNDDTVIDDADREIITQHYAAEQVDSIRAEHPGWILSGWQKKAADVNSDGVVDSRDVLKIIYHCKASPEHPDWYITTGFAW